MGSVVTLTTTVYEPITTQSEITETSNMYGPPPDPTTSSSSIITRHGPCYPSPPFSLIPWSSSSPSEEASLSVVTVTETEKMSVTQTETVTVVYSTVLKTVSTRGPYAPPLTTW